MAGGRTSVSAPLDLNRTKTDPMGGQETWIGNSQSASIPTTRPVDPAPRWRGDGPRCPLRWTSLCKPPPQWAVHPPGSEPHPHSIAKHPEKSKVRHPPKPFPEGEIFHSPGLTRSGYPGWGTSIMTVEPQRGSLDAGCDWNSGSIGPRTSETGHNPPHGLS